MFIEEVIYPSVIALVDEEYLPHVGGMETPPVEVHGYVVHNWVMSLGLRVDVKRLQR